MKIFISILILLLIISAFYIVPIINSVVISKKIISQTVPFSQVNKDAELTILVAGDSTVFGTGAENPNDSIAGRFAIDYPESEIFNLSESGLKTDGLLEKLEIHLENKTYDYIHIQIGANDIVSFTNYESLEKDLISILDLVSEKSDNVTILTAADVGDVKVFKYPISKYLSIRTKVIRDIFINSISKYENIEYIDLYSNKEMIKKFKEDPEKYYAEDMFHPNGLAYGLWYDAIKDKFGK